MWGDKKPCDEAFWAEGFTTDKRTFKSEEEHDSKFPRLPWRSKGINHRMWRDGQRPSRWGIARDIPGERWYLNIETLNDLKRLIGNYGSIVVQEDDGDAELSVEIYDDYRE